MRKRPKPKKPSIVFICGTAIAASKKGEQLWIPSETLLEFRLQQPAPLPVAARIDYSEHRLASMLRNFAYPFVLFRPCVFLARRRIRFNQFEQNAFDISIGLAGALRIASAYTYKGDQMGIEIGSPRKSEGVCRSKTLTQRVLCVLLVGAGCFAASILCLGQEKQGAAEPPASRNSQVKADSPNTADQSAQPTAPAKPETQPEKKKKLGGPGAFVVAPIPISSPAIGSGIVPVVGYIFPFSTKDKVSPPSTVGVAGLITNNGSRGFVVGGQLFLKENTYEITSGFAHGNVNYKNTATDLRRVSSYPCSRLVRATSVNSCAASGGNCFWALDLSLDVRLLRSGRIV
jgi:hypothetical protein